MKIETVILSKKWNDVHIRKGLIERVLSQHLIPAQAVNSKKDPSLHWDDVGEITLALSTDAHVKQLNNDFRAKDNPTNVLSFPNHAHNGGDIILAIETVKREARAEDKPLRDHLEHLIIHGILHCFGYDHENDRDWDEMVKMEVKICTMLGFHPYPE